MTEITLFDRQDKYNTKFIPAVIIMRDKTLSISLDRLEIDKSMIFKTQILKIGKYKCITRDIQRHPVSEKILHIDLLEVSANQIVRINIPLKFINREMSEDLKFGSILNRQFRYIKVKIHAHDIPESFEIDLKERKFKFFLEDIIDFKKYNIQILNVQKGQSVATIKRARGAKALDATA